MRGCVRKSTLRRRTDSTLSERTLSKWLLCIYVYIRVWWITGVRLLRGLSCFRKVELLWLFLLLQDLLLHLRKYFRNPPHVQPPPTHPPPSHYRRVPVSVSIHRLPDGSGLTGFSQKGHKSFHFVIFCFKRAHVATFCNILPHVATFCNSLSYFVTFCPHVPWEFMRGNRGTFATTRFVLTPSGSCQHTLWRLTIA